MKKKGILLSLLILLTTFVLGLCSACAEKASKVDELRKSGYVEITYDAGESGLFAHGRYAYFMIPSGSKTVEPNIDAKESEEASVFRAPTREKYDLVGWFLQDESGNVATEHFDFSTPIEKDIVLVADWQPRYYFYFATETGEKIDEDNRIWVKGEGTTAVIIKAPSRKGYTLLGYYKDPACTIELEKNTDGKYVTPAHSSNSEDLIYTKWLEGEYVFVSTAKDFLSAVNSGKGCYLEADIDFTGVTWNRRAIYSGNIAGNGHTISNISFSHEATRGNYQFGLFGKYSGTMTDVTFKNCSLSFVAPKAQSNNAEYKVGFVCGVLGSGASLKNVSFDTCSLSIDASDFSSYGYLVFTTDAGITGVLEENVNLDNVTGSIQVENVRN